MVSLQDFFDYPYKKGYVRVPTDDGCYYITEQQMKDLLLEDLKSTKYYKEVIDGE